MVLLSPGAARAAEFDGAQLAGWWAIPFAGILLSIAVLPLVAPWVWHHHYGKIALGWALAFFVPFALVFGVGSAGAGLVHAMAAEYLPFIILLTALFTVAGGIYIRGNLHGSPALNCLLIAIGAVLASFMGTTGASMLMIRPLIRANDDRRRTAHVVIFFIFIVSNIAGSLTPLGDPPLFLGFLKGVTFFWTMTLFPETLFCTVVLLAIFFALDTWLYRREGARRPDPTPDDETLGVDGKANLLLLLAIMGLVLLSGTWNPGIAWSLMGTEITLQQVVRDLALVAITALSLAITARSVREANQYSFGPMLEVAKLFFGIFLTIIPVIAMLRAGADGAFAPIVRLVTGPDGQPIPAAYFWATGILSSFLDNAPTYLVFFNLAGGDPQQLMTTLAPVLMAVSAGAVFMGANSYIGNAPNLMVKAVAEDRGVKMPGFFGYMAWSVGILVPLFGVVTWIWYR
jgi:Na+/H+ antiporter NhaD/arsenite permease-like protein